MARTRRIEQATAVAKPRDKAKPRLEVAPKAQKVAPAKSTRASSRRRRDEPADRGCDSSTPELEFMQAMQEYKKSSGRMFPTWSEVLEVLQNLGYRKLGQDASPVAPSPISESA